MLELAKVIHEAIGIQSPRLFIAASFLIFGIVGAALGWAIDAGYRVRLTQDQAKTEVVGKASPATPASGQATTHGDNSPAITGDGNTVKYGGEKRPKE